MFPKHLLWTELKKGDIILLGLHLLKVCKDDNDDFELEIIQTIRKIKQKRSWKKLISINNNLKIGRIIQKQFKYDGEMSGKHG